MTKIPALQSHCFKFVGLTVREITYYLMRTIVSIIVNCTDVEIAKKKATLTITYTFLKSNNPLQKLDHPAIQVSRLMLLAYLPRRTHDKNKPKKTGCAFTSKMGNWPCPATHKSEHFIAVNSGAWSSPSG